MSTPQAPLTRKSYLEMSVEDLKKIVADPQKLTEVNAILDGSVIPEVVQDAAAIAADAAADAAVAQTPEQIESERLAAEAKAVEDKAVADKAAADKIEADKAAADAEEQAYKDAGITVTKDASGSITKLTLNYQARDEAGNPIGRQTYLEGKTWLELVTKERAAHENAVRYSERLKKQKVTVKKDDPNEVKPLTEAEFAKLQEDLKSEDRDKASKAAQQLREVDAQNAVRAATEAKASYEFLTDHIEDYNRCEANNKVLSDFIRGNNLEWNLENLEFALTSLGSKLAPKEQPVPVPINPAPVTTAIVVPPPTAVAQPAPPVVSNQPAPPAPVTLPAARPGVNGGIVPGATSASRPANQPKGLTKADVKNMPPAEYRRRLKDPKFVAEVNALQIKHGL